MTNINNQSQSLDKIAGLEDLNHENAAVCSGGASIILYDGADLTGESKSFSISSVPSLFRYNFNDRASSIKVGSGKWQLFQDVNFAGFSNTFTSGAYNLTQLNNQVSSLKTV
ncbi:beta/gamma crystallin family protein [Plectonema radiosum NIES-515]|uniref:Beta/gamma crystallin family protein n=1 Tax=Plectonema radiosum NIES-515 TaxID=2986073 RepID=A0ABT3B805_9CYAN|nr:beta/gamma crystallin family protein [Plectonema radiosum]MCV3217511.1 beta/gamma crystallin family protein [Plectonema radiosum NIES-515]